MWVIMLDGSSSMAGPFSNTDHFQSGLAGISRQQTRYRAACDAIARHSRLLDNTQRVTVYKFSTTATLLGSFACGETTKIIAAVEVEQPDGGTDVAEAIRSGVVALQSKGDRRLLIITDCETDPDEAESAAMAAASAGILIFVIIIDPSKEAERLAEKIAGKNVQFVTSANQLDEAILNVSAKSAEIRSKIESSLGQALAESRTLTSSKSDTARPTFLLGALMALVKLPFLIAAKAGRLAGGFVDRLCDRETGTESDEGVRFSTTWRSDIAHKSSNPIIVAAHSTHFDPDLLSKLLRDLTAGQKPSAAAQSDQGSSRIDAGTSLLFEVEETKDLDVLPPSQLVIWSPPLQVAVFWASIRKRSNSTAGLSPAATFRIAADGVVVARLRVSLAVTERNCGDSSYQTSTDYLPTTIFASYAREDLSIVRYYSRIWHDTGVTYFLDVESLRSGEYWQEKLYSAIERSDLFQLFWSHNASISEWVRREWTAALAIEQQDRSHFIRLLSWENPPPPLPPEISHMHLAQSSLFSPLVTTIDEELIDTADRDANVISARDLENDGLSKHVASPIIERKSTEPESTQPAPSAGCSLNVQADAINASAKTLASLVMRITHESDLPALLKGFREACQECIRFMTSSVVPGSITNQEILGIMTARNGISGALDHSAKIKSLLTLDEEMRYGGRSLSLEETAQAVMMVRALSGLLFEPLVAGEKSSPHGGTTESC